MTKDQTISLIRGLREAHSAAFGKRPRVGRMTAPLKPAAIQAEYLKGIRDLVLLPMALRMNALLPKLPLKRDAADDGENTRALIERLAKQFAEDVTPAQMERLAGAIGKRTSDFQREQLKRQMKQAVGVDPLFHEPAEIEERIRGFTAENVALIKSVPARFFSEVESRLVAMVRQGARAEEIGGELADRLEVAESNAARIARDQVGKFFGEVNRVRQESIGIDGYFWRGMGDNREREEHVLREGRRYAWSDPPVGGHPGEDYLCRCWPEPDLTAILEDVRADAYGGGPFKLPQDHVAGLRVPKGGSCCANCRFLAPDKASCTEPNWVRWHANDPKLPAPADEYCSDFWRGG